MARIIGIDYGRKRTGIAVTDPEQIIVSGLATIPTQTLMSYLKEYYVLEGFEKIVIGHPALLDPGSSVLSNDIEDAKRALQKRFPEVPVVFHDESFSSEQAKRIILSSGAKRKKRQKKALVDQVSAVLILQDYLGHI